MTSGKKKRGLFENCKSSKTDRQRVCVSVSSTCTSTSIKQKKGKSAHIRTEKQSNSLSTADRHSQHNNSSHQEKNVRVTNKKTKLSTCSGTKVHSRPHSSINSFSNKYEMVDRDISTSSKTDVNIYGAETTTTTTSSSTNNNPNSNRIDRNSNTLPSGSTNLSRNNGNTKMTSSAVPHQSEPTTVSSTSTPTKSNTNNNNKQEGTLCDNNNVGTALSGTHQDSTSSVTVETVKKVKKSRKDKERNSDGSKKSSSSRNPDSHKKRRVKVAQTDYSTIERTDAEGAASEDLVDFDNDPDSAEWVKLRCTSQSTEVVQEREQRRQKRCADYPGLAFGRSVFSSDTLMKFSIIRNELHNIMKSQLKRVNICTYQLITFTQNSLTACEKV